MVMEILSLGDNTLHHLYRKSKLNKQPKESQRNSQTAQK